MFWAISNASYSTQKLSLILFMENANANISIDPSKILNPIKPLHGVNRGPLDWWGVVDLSVPFIEAKIPSIRTHDVHLIFREACDLHCMFPNPKADPTKEENYTFGHTDDYLKAIAGTGAQAYFRLGESIEHQERKKFILSSIWEPNQLAQVCLHIVKHYNEGWANGFHYGIKYWEFWNEPDLASQKCWAGTPGEWEPLYRAVAPLLKKTFPDIKIGLAGFAHLQQKDLPYRPVLEKLAKDKVPIDFVSWHNYSDHFQKLIKVTRENNEFLESIGLGNVESHCTEWGYITKRKPEEKLGSSMKLNWFQERVTGTRRPDETAAFVFGGLAKLQDERVQLSHYYTGDCHRSWGLFDADTQPMPAYYSIKLFSEFVSSKEVELNRVSATATDANHAVLAAANKDQSKLLVGFCNLRGPDKINFSIKGDRKYRLIRKRVINIEDKLSEVSLDAVANWANADISNPDKSVTAFEFALS